MKAFALAMLLVASVSALPNKVPQNANERFVDGVVQDFITSVINWIQDRRLDPVNIAEWSGSYKLPVTDMFEAKAAVTDVQSAGLSNIVINDLSYSILDSRLVVSLSLPSVASSVGSAEGSARLISYTLSAAISGSLSLSDLNVSADITAGFGIITGIFVRSVDVDFSLGGIESDLSITINDRDVSDAVNNFLGNTLPNALSDNADEINELLEYIITRVLEGLRD